MSSYAMLYLSDGRSVCSFRNGVDQLFFNLFTRRDWIELSGVDAYDLAQHSYVDLDPSDATVVGFQITAGALRDRLDVMGVDIELLRRELGHLIAEQTRRKSDLLESFSAAPDITSAITAELSSWAAISAESWFLQLRQGLELGQRVERFGARHEVGSASWLMSVWEYHDPRYENDSLLPIEWGGYVRGVDAYQGAVAGKGALQERFRAKVSAARTHQEDELADWSGIDLVLDHVIVAIRSASPTEPSERV